MALTKIPANLLDTSSHVDFADNEQLRLGSGADGTIHHDGSHFRLRAGTGNFNVQANDFHITDASNSAVRFVVDHDGETRLYHNGNIKLTTTSTGATVTGNLNLGDSGRAVFGNNADLQIFHDGSNSFINNTSGDAGTLSIKSHDINLMSSASETMAKFEEDGPVRLYHDNAQKLMTLSSGVNVTGDLEVSGNLNITGDINSTSVTNLDVVDKTITVANNAGSASNANGAGIVVDTGTNNPQMIYGSTTDEWDFNRSIHVSGAAGSGVKIDAGGAIVGGGATGGDTQLIYWGGGPMYYGRSSLGGTVSGHELRIGGVTKLNVNSSGNTIMSGKVGIATDTNHAGNALGYGLTIDTAGTSGSGLELHRTGNSRFEIYQNSTGQVYLDAIGSSNPFLGFSINGSIKGRWDSSGRFLANATAAGARAAHTFQRTGSFAGEFIQAQSGAGASVLGLTYTAAAPNNQTDYFIYAQDTAGIKYRLFADGSQHNAGSVIANSFRPGNADNRWKIRGNSGNAQMVFEYSTSSGLSDSHIKMKLMDSGRVGIGPNITPLQLFHVGAGSSASTVVRFGQQFDTNVEIGPVTATASGMLTFLNGSGSSKWALGYRDSGAGTDGVFRLRRGATLDTAGPNTTWSSTGQQTIATTTQDNTTIAQLELVNNVNANPSHVNLKFTTYAWLGMLQVEQRAAGQYGAMNFWTAKNANPVQRMTLNHEGDLAIATSNAQDGFHSKHRKIEVTGSTAATATSWSTSPGNNGGYDVSNDDASDFDHYGSVSAAGYFNKHVVHWSLRGNYSANTWYPFATQNQIVDWVTNNQTGANAFDGFPLYFRIYTYDVSAGGSEYLTSRVSDRIWVANYTSNSNQRHNIALGAGWGHAPNGGDTGDHQDYDGPYRLSVKHHYNTDSYYPARPTVEIQFATSRTGLTGSGSYVVDIYGYVG